MSASCPFALLDLPLETTAAAVEARFLALTTDTDRTSPEEAARLRAAYLALKTEARLETARRRARRARGLAAAGTRLATAIGIAEDADGPILVFALAGPVAAGPLRLEPVHRAEDNSFTAASGRTLAVRLTLDQDIPDGGRGAAVETCLPGCDRPVRIEIRAVDPKEIPERRPGRQLPLLGGRKPRPGLRGVRGPRLLARLLRAA